MVDIPPGLMLLPDWTFWTLIGGVLFALFLLFIIIIIFTVTPAAAFLSAKLGNKPVFLMSGRDGFGGFHVPQFFENQFAHFKKAGVYGISRDSHILDRKSKQPIYIADKDIGITYQRDWPRLMEQLQEAFPRMKTGKDYKDVIEAALKAQNDPEKNPSLFINGTTIKVSDLAKFFPNNIKPAFIEYYAEVAVRRERRKQNTMQFWAVFAIIILMIGIAGYLLMAQANKNQTKCTCDIGNAVEQVCGLKTNQPGLQAYVNGSQSVIQEIKPSNSKPGVVLS